MYPLQPSIEIVEVDNVSLKPKTTEKKNKSDRRPKTLVPIKNSRSLDAMPEWAQNKWKALRAGICDVYGEAERPFYLAEGPEGEFARNVESVVHATVPEQNDFKVSTSKCKVYGKVRSSSLTLLPSTSRSFRLAC